MAMSLNIGMVVSDAIVSIVVVVLPVCVGGSRVTLVLSISLVVSSRMSIHMPLLMVVGVVN